MQVNMEVVWTDTEAYNGKEDKTASKRVPHHTKKDKDIIRKAIKHWRAIVWKCDFSTEGFSFYSLEAVMSDHILETLVSKCAKVCAANSIDSFLNWIPRKPEYIQDLTSILMGINDTIAARQEHKSASTEHHNEPQCGSGPEPTFSIVQYAPAPPTPTPARSSAKQPCLDSTGNTFFFSTPVFLNETTFGSIARFVKAIYRHLVRA